MVRKSIKPARSGFNINHKVVGQDDNQQINKVLELDNQSNQKQIKVGLSNNHKVVGQDNNQKINEVLVYKINQSRRKWV